jgi:protein TonB
MNLQSLQKEVESSPVKTEVVPEDNSTNAANENSLTEKTKTNRENILIKEPNLFQLRDFFKEKTNETVKEKPLPLENRVKAINEPEIKITKSAEGVIKLIKQPMKEVIKPTKVDVVVSTEPVKDLIKSTKEVIQLKKIIEEEFNKAKEGLSNIHKESEEEIVKTAEEKIIVNKQPAKTIVKPVEEKSNLAKEPVKEIIKTSEDNNKIDSQPTKTTINTTEKKINPSKESAREIIKTAEVKETITQQSSKTIIERVESKSSPTKKSEDELNKSDKQKNVNTRRDLRELSSLSIEDKKSYFKTKKEPPSQILKRSLIITIGLLILSVSFIVYSNFSSKVQDNHPEKLIAQTIPESDKDKINQTNPEKVTSIVEKGQGNEGANPIDAQTTKESVLPPPPEIPAMMEAPSSELVDNFEIDNKEAIKNLEEKSPMAPPKEEKKIEEEPSFFVAVEEMPEPLGGLGEIQKRIEYPKVASLTGVEGKVYVRALVNESGNVANAEVIKGIGAGCDEAALEAVLKTKFKPGIQRGKPVKVQVTIPIVFKKK